MGAYNILVSQAIDNVQPTRPLRVGWVAGRETLSQLGRILQPLAVGLVDELVELVVLCPDSRVPDELPSPPLEVLTYAPPRWWESTRKAVDCVAQRVGGLKLDLLHGLDESAAKLTAGLARTLDLKYVISSYAFGGPGRLKRLDDRAAGVLPACEVVRDYLLKHRVAGEQKVHLLHPGVYLAGEPTCFATPGRSVTVLVGGSAEAGAFEAVLRSFAELHERNYDCAYFLLGAGKAERALRGRVNRHGLRQEVTFVGEQSPRQLVGVLEAADIYVAPAPSRRVDVRCLLAMASGTPVLAALDAEDFLVDGKTVLHFPQGDSAELTMKLLSLIDDPEAAKDLARSALAHLGEYHRSADMVAAVAEIYRAAGGR